MQHSSVAPRRCRCSTTNRDDCPCGSLLQVRCVVACYDVTWCLVGQRLPLRHRLFCRAFPRLDLPAASLSLSLFSPRLSGPIGFLLAPMPLVSMGFNGGYEQLAESVFEYGARLRRPGQVRPFTN